LPVISDIVSIIWFQVVLFRVSSSASTSTTGSTIAAASVLAFVVFITASANHVLVHAHVNSTT